MTTSPPAEYDFFGLDPCSLEDPYTYFDLARARGPVYREPHRGVYIVSGYDAVLEIEKDTERFSMLLVATGPTAGFPDALDPARVGDEIARYREEHDLELVPLLSYDPPEHQRYRALVSKLFTPKRVREVEAGLSQLAHRLIDEFAGEGEIEFVHRFAGPFPLMAIADLLGVPREDQMEFKRLLQDDMTDQDLVGNPDPAAIRTDLQAHIVGYLGNLIQDRQAHPRDDAITAIVTTPFADTGELPNLIDLIKITFVVFGAGQETTARLFGNGMQVLLDRPDVLARLRADPTRIPTFVEEVLRYDTPVKGLFRLTRVEVEVAGTVIPAGSIVMLAYGAANRDPAKYPCPHEFDLERAGAVPTLSFGHGAHFCPGANLARIEGRVGFEALLSRLHGLRLAEGRNTFEHVPSFVLRGLRELWIDFDVAGS